jgi:rubrerythrin
MSEKLREFCNNLKEALADENKAYSTEYPKLADLLFQATIDTGEASETVERDFQIIRVISKQEAAHETVLQDIFNKRCQGV